MSQLTDNAGWVDAAYITHTWLAGTRCLLPIQQSTIVRFHPEIAAAPVSSRLGASNDKGSLCDEHSLLSASQPAPLNCISSPHQTTPLDIASIFVRFTQWHSALPTDAFLPSDAGNLVDERSNFPPRPLSSSGGHPQRQRTTTTKHRGPSSNPDARISNILLSALRSNPDSHAVLGAQLPLVAIPAVSPTAPPRMP